MKSKSIIVKHRWLLWRIIITITLLWGYGWVAMKGALAYMGPFTFRAFRFTIGSLNL